jgi:hypothetical protein
MTRVSRATRKQQEKESPYIPIAKCPWKIGQKVRCKPRKTHQHYKHIIKQGIHKLVGKVISLYEPDYRYHNDNAPMVCIEWYYKAFKGTYTICFHSYEVVKA